MPNGALRFTPPDAIAKNAPKPPRPENGVNWGRVWVVKGTKIAPVDLKLGATNGRETQVLSGGLAAGDEVATDIVKPGGEGQQPRHEPAGPHRSQRGDQGLRAWRSLRGGARRHRCADRQRRIRRRHGPFGLGQIHLHEHIGLSRYAHLGTLFLSRRRCRQPDPGPARAAQTLLHRLRVPGLQSAQAHDGDGESRTAADLSRRAQGRTPRPRARGVEAGGAGRSGRPYALPNFPAASSSAWRSRARW